MKNKDQFKDYPVKKQTDIIKFTNTFTRESLKGFGPLSEKENENWLYCIKSNVALLPNFVHSKFAGSVAGFGISILLWFKYGQFDAKVT